MNDQDKGVVDAKVPKFLQRQPWYAAGLDDDIIHLILGEFKDDDPDDLQAAVTKIYGILAKARMAPLRRFLASKLVFDKDSKQQWLILNRIRERSATIPNRRMSLMKRVSSQATSGLLSMLSSKPSYSHDSEK